MKNRRRASGEGSPASGYSQVLADEAHHGFPVLQKPCSIGELGRMLRSARRAS